MYQIFIADKNLTLLQDRSAKTNNRHLVMYYENDISIKTAIETLEQSSFYNSAEIIFDDLSELWSVFKNQFLIIEAAGGIVLNSKGKILMIYRHNKWDLPKGKIEKYEKKKAAAMREVEEECGISGLTIKQTLPSTYHTYNLNGKRVLKISHWYEMKTNDEKKLIPQLEEDIAEARWVEKNDIPELLNNTYASIKLLMENYLRNKSSSEK